MVKITVLQFCGRITSSLYANLIGWNQYLSLEVRYSNSELGFKLYASENPWAHGHILSDVINRDTPKKGSWPLREGTILCRHRWLGMPYKRVALGKIRCFSLSQAAREVQQVQETANSPLHANGLVSGSQVRAVWLCETMNGLQATDYLQHVMWERLDS